jgi:hypothetical protein
MTTEGVDGVQIADLPKRLNALVQKFYEAANEVYESIDPIVSVTQQAPIYTHLLLYAVCDQIKDIASGMETMANKNMPIVAERAEKIMSAEDIEKIRYMGKDFSCDVKPYAQTKASDKDKVINWLKNNVSGAHLVSEGYHPQSFQKFVREEIIAKGIVPPPFISIHNKPILLVRKAPERG